MRTAIALLALLLLGAGCNDRPAGPPPPPAVQDPPPEGPLSYSLVGFSLYKEQTDLNIIGQIYVGPKEGGDLEKFGALNGYSLDLRPEILRLREGRVEVWGKDHGVYGGRRFHWVYPYHFDDSGFPPTLVFPDGPVRFEVVDRFPWGDQDPDDPAVVESLRTVSLLGGLELCIRQPWNPPEGPLRRGLWAMGYLRSGPASENRATPNWLYMYVWHDGKFVTRAGVEDGFSFYLGPYTPESGYMNPTYFDPTPTTHSLLLISKSLGIGKYRQPWEGRWFRTYNRGLGAWPDSTQFGGVRCEFGEGWRVEEITDPEEIALLEAYQVNMKQNRYWELPPYTPPALDPRLCPKPWRRSDGGCDAGPWPGPR